MRATIWTGLKAKGLVFVLPFLAAGALAFAQNGHQFGHLQLQQPDGRQLRLTAGTAHVVPGDMLVIPFEGEGVSAEIQLPAHTAPAHRVLAPVRIEEGGRVLRGVAELEVEEAGRFVSGRLQADIGGWSLAGGLRVRAELPSAPRATCRDGLACAQAERAVPNGRRISAVR